MLPKIKKLLLFGVFMTLTLLLGRFPPGDVYDPGNGRSMSTDVYQIS